MRGASALAAGLLSYLGYDAARSPLLDPNVCDLLGLAGALLADHGTATTGLAEAKIATARPGDAPRGQIAPQAPLWNDLEPVIRQIVANRRWPGRSSTRCSSRRPRSSAGGSPTS